MKRLLTKLARMAYRMGQDDGRMGCNADDTAIEKLVLKILGR